MVNDAVLHAVEDALVARYGLVPRRASISFLGVDPIEVLRFEPAGDERHLVTLGMSRYPMTGAQESVVSSDGPRAELVLALRDPTDLFTDVWRSLAVLAAAPAVEGVVYAAGASSDLGQSLAPGASCTGVVLGDAVLTVQASAGPVEVFEVFPATPAELAWCRVRGSAALRERWTEQEIDLLDLSRAPVRLDPA